MRDGEYKTKPKWGEAVRVVRVTEGCVELVESPKFKFTVKDFFSVNDLIINGNRIEAHYL